METYWADLFIKFRTNYATISMYRRTRHTHYKNVVRTGAVSMVKRRNSRQDAIREIVRGKSIKTQHALVEELEAEGFACTPATVSRDIADMGLRKLPEGVYVLAEDLHMQRMVSELVQHVNCADNLVLVKAQPGTAPGIAAAIDAADLSEVVGTIAGNDTVLVVTDLAEKAHVFASLINNLRNA